MRFILILIALLGCSELDKLRKPQQVDHRSDSGSSCEIISDTDSAVELYCKGRSVLIPKGADGKDSDFSCATEELDDGFKVTCSNGQSFVLRHGVKGDAGADGKDGESLLCQSQPVEDGILVSCSDGNEFVLYNGKDGLSTNGVDGKSVTCESEYITGGVQVTCSDGNTFVVENGQDGSNGLDGITPEDGVDGYSSVFSVIAATQCSNGGSTIFLATDTNRNGVLDTSDSNITSATICNGINGANGVDGVDGAQGPKGDQGDAGADGVSPTFTAIQLIDPCEDQQGIMDEILLRLSDGTIIASVSDKANGENTRFSVITPGSYMTTDGSKCYFTVDASGNIVNQHY